MMLRPGGAEQMPRGSGRITALPGGGRCRHRPGTPGSRPAGRGKATGDLCWAKPKNALFSPKRVPCGQAGGGRPPEGASISSFPAGPGTPCPGCPGGDGTEPPPPPPTPHPPASPPGQPAGTGTSPGQALNREGEEVGGLI